MYELYSIVNNGDLGRLESYLSSHQAIVSDNSLNADLLMDHCRLLALTKICSSKHQMNYGEIASSLKVQSEEVEMYLVRAVQFGLVEGKIDQIKEEFTVMYVFKYSFGFCEIFNF